MLLLPGLLLGLLQHAGTAAADDEGDACAGHTECGEGKYCNQQGECAACLDEGEEVCVTWGDSLDGSCSSCGVEAPHDEVVPTGAEQIHAYLASERRRRASEYVDEAARLVATATSIFGSAGPAKKKGRKARLKRMALSEVTEEEFNAFDYGLDGAKLSLVAALELGEADPRTWKRGAKLLLSVLDIQHSVGYSSRAVTADDVSHFLSGACKQHPHLESELYELVAEAGMEQRIGQLVCSSNNEVQHLSAGGAEDALPRLGGTPRLNAGHASHAGMLVHAPKMTELSASASASPLSPVAKALTTRQLWPTLVSHVNLISAGILTEAQVDALNAATLDAYQRFLIERNSQPDMSKRNDEFYNWQGAGNFQAGGGRIEGVQQELAALRRVAIEACTAHVLKHERPQSAEVSNNSFPKPNKLYAV